jgi:hypothetical protein
MLVDPQASTIPQLGILGGPLEANWISPFLCLSQQTVSTDYSFREFVTVARILNLQHLLRPSADAFRNGRDHFFRLGSSEDEPHSFPSLGHYWENDRIPSKSSLVDVEGQVEVVLRAGPDRTNLSHELWLIVPLVDGYPEKACIIRTPPHTMGPDGVQKQLDQTLNLFLRLGLLA